MRGNDTNVQNHEGIRCCRMGEKIEQKARKRGNNLSFNRESYKNKRTKNYTFYVRERHHFFFNRAVPSWNISTPNVIKLRKITFSYLFV